MHTKEVLNAIYDNHLYEYVIINRNFEVLEYSDNVSLYCAQDSFRQKETDLFAAFPELFCMEDALLQAFHTEKTAFTIPLVFKEPDYYVNIHVHGGTYSEGIQKDKSNYETLIILFENATIPAKREHQALQDRNENAILLQEVAEKNAQLKIFNEEMKRLVKEEVLKNMEQQRTIEIQSRHSQMGEMIAMITHQWKQPISVIHTICTLLQIKYKQNTLDKTTFNEKIESILKQSRYMNQTIYDFQHFFNPSKKKEVFNVMNTMRSILSLVELGYTLHNIEIILEGDDDIAIYGHSNEYSQVVLSILQNAKDAFLSQPHTNMKIFMELSNVNENSLLKIKDNAGGISDDVIGQIFNLYTTTKEEGSGIGLHIAKNVVEKNMSGELTVKNVENGAEFSILI